MRLLNVNNYHYRRGGAETVYLEHGALFAARGWDINWFSMKHPLTLADADQTHFAEVIDLEYMQGKAAKLKAASAIIYNREAKRQIESLISMHRPDVAHLHNIYHHLSPSVLTALKSRNIPTVMTAHDLKLVCPNYKMLADDGLCERCKGGRIWNVVVHKCMKGSRSLSGLIAVETAIHRATGIYRDTIDRIVTPSLFYKDKLIEWGWPESKIKYIPNFVSAEINRTAIPIDATLVYFGRLSEEKGVATLIRAAARSGIRVKIAGTGPEEENLRALAINLKAPVSFEGYRSGAALNDLIKNARAVILPSEWFENAPMSVIEAYSLCRPILGADIGGIPELIRTNETGWIFRSGNVESLASAMEMIMKVPVEHLTEMGQRGADMVLEKFSASAYFTRMSELYGELGVIK